jgi:very-long-chain ceramide synthase
MLRHSPHVFCPCILQTDHSCYDLWLTVVVTQIGLSFNLLALLFLAHVFIPKARAHTHKFFHLSYYNPSTEKYASGFDDLYLIAYCIVLFTGLRAWTMEYVVAPIGKLRQITKRKDLTRFSEQGWMLIYYLVFWPLGMVRDLDHS